MSACCDALAHCDIFSRMVACSRTLVLSALLQVASHACFHHIAACLVIVVVMIQMQGAEGEIDIVVEALFELLCS